MTTVDLKKAAEQSTALEERMKAIDEMQTSATKEKAEAALMQMHPDFDEIRDSDDFHNWAEEQPKWVQDALYDNDNDARSAARAIDLYKSDSREIFEKTTHRTSHCLFQQRNNVFCHLTRIPTDAYHPEHV